MDLALISCGVEELEWDRGLSLLSQTHQPGHLGLLLQSSWPQFPYMCEENITRWSLRCLLELRFGAGWRRSVICGNCSQPCACRGVSSGGERSWSLLFNFLPHERGRVGTEPLWATWPLCWIRLAELPLRICQMGLFREGFGRNYLIGFIFPEPVCAQKAASSLSYRMHCCYLD